MCTAPLQASASTDSRAKAAVIEIIETTDKGEVKSAVDETFAAAIPNQVRINGMPVLVTEDSIKISDLNRTELLTVTLTLIAKRVVLGYAEG